MLEDVDDEMIDGGDWPGQLNKRMPVKSSPSCAWEEGEVGHSPNLEALLSRHMSSSTDDTLSTK